MNTTDTAREARTRNLARLRKLTIGTAALGMAATSGFSFLAAATYAGHATASAATAYTTSVAATAPSGVTSGTTANTSGTTASTSGTTFTAPAVTSTSGFGHVSSGGS